MFLNTERLFLRNLASEDIPLISAYRNDPICAKFQRWENTSLTAVSQFVESFRQCIFLSNQAEQHYAICLNNGTLVGDLSYFFTEADACVTLGITIAPEYQRMGIAREMLAAVISAIQEKLPQLDIVALIDPANNASIALFEGLGFYRECYAESIRSFVYVIDGTR